MPLNPYNPDEPDLHIPLEKLDKCSACNKIDAKLRWCSSCGEILYCSTECQKGDWKRHKVECGQTDRIDLESFYPLIAAAQAGHRMHPDAINHPALQHSIVSSPNPGTYDDIVPLPNGASARLVLLGDKIKEDEVASPKWWPSALTPKVRSKMMRRIVGEGLLLPIVLATTLALVGEMYTTTAVPLPYKPENQFTGRRRVRLQYNKAPISDIGIAKGTCTRVTGQDRLCYYNLNTDEFLMGQDPTDHYWIYFTTLDGHEYFLDCGMFTFNFSQIVDITKQQILGTPPLGYIPAFFYNKDLEKVLPTTTGQLGWKPDKRFSILRNEDLCDSMRRREEYCRCHDMPVLLRWLRKIAERSTTSWEENMFLTFFENSAMIFRLNLKNRTYINFPKQPAVAFELDPDESLKPSSDHPQEDEALGKYLKKWTKKLKRGQISGEQWNKAFNRWNEKPYEQRMRMAGMSENSIRQKTMDHGSSCDGPAKGQTNEVPADPKATEPKGKEKGKEMDAPTKEMTDRMSRLGQMMAERDVMHARYIMQNNASAHAARIRENLSK